FSRDWSSDVCSSDLAVVSTLSPRARAARLDVTDAAAVQAVVDDVVARTGRLDLIFNNAGIVWGGDTELLTLDQWNAIIDINLRRSEERRVGEEGRQV